MDKQLSMALGLAAAVAVAAFAVHRWRERARVRGVGAWVKRFLQSRYGSLPGNLTINCTDDRLWPVLVAFSDPRTGKRHTMQFDCGGPAASYALRTEEDARS